MLDNVVPEQTVKFPNKHIKPWFNKCIRDQRKIVKTETVFGESADININGRLTQKRETNTIAFLSTTGNKPYQTK